jgi:radical SAM superfamily enzyme YgiQ (UPF0313 family)
MNKRILLVNPPYPVDDCPSPPLGLMSLGAYLENNGYDVMIDDLVVNSFARERAERIAAEFSPGFIGITGATMNIKKSLEALSLYRELLPGAVTIAGGPHVTFDAEAVLRDNPRLDFVVRGEGELTLEELLSAVRGDRDYSKINGLSFRKGAANIHNSAREFIRDINILPPPDLRLAELGKYRALGLPVNMTTSRGCPHRCIFCAGNRMVGNRVRYFHTERVVDEFESLAETGARQINIADDLFTANRKRCMEICSGIIRRGITREWSAFARVDTVSEELLSIMKKAGCTTLCFGIESGNQEILDRAKKKTNLKMCRNAADICRKTGIRFMAAYILGLPGETPETVKRTLEFSRSLSDAYGYHILAPFPGSEVREKAREFEIKIFTSDWDLYDAKHAVSETACLEAAEVERVIAGYQEGVDKYLRNIKRRAGRGDDLSDDELEVLGNVKSREFARRLIFSDVIDGFNREGNGEGRKAVESFADYVSREMPMEREDAMGEIERLIKKSCIKISGGNDNKHVAWC